MFALLSRAIEEDEHALEGARVMAVREYPGYPSEGREGGTRVPLRVLRGGA